MDLYVIPNLQPSCFKVLVYRLICHHMFVMHHTYRSIFLHAIIRAVWINFVLEHLQMSCQLESKQYGPFPMIAQFHWPHAVAMVSADFSYISLLRRCFFHPRQLGEKNVCSLERLIYWVSIWWHNVFLANQN